MLAFDAATEVLSVGLENNGKRFYLTIDGGQKHSEKIMDAADMLLGIAGTSKSELEAAACMEGPGSFTGLRIGFAAAKGLSFALGIPIIPVPTLDCMAASSAHWPGIVLPVIDAKKKAFFTSLYYRGKRLSPYLDIGLPALISLITDTCIRQRINSSSPALLVTGPAAPLVLSDITAAFPGTVSDCACKRGYATELLNLAGKMIIFKKEADVFSAGPLYLRKSDAELNEVNG
jgi:tRNA threonylcarbamoyladenosine biosynthesis protein TsaB